MNANAEVRTSGSPDSLRNLGRIGLEVEPLPRPLLKEGLSRDDVFNLVRARLQRGTVQILNRTGALHVKGAPTLFLRLTLFRWRPRYYLYAVALELVQGVRLERLRDSTRFFAAPTWIAWAVGLVQQGQWPFLQEQISATVDAFVDAKDGAAS
jgi:hypothetical protein